jgi:cyclopropane fatty-acyl-phospholipid synthase-like methyltransferase
MTESSRGIVAAGYDRIGPRYREWSAGSPNRLAYVDRVLARLRPGSTVLDLGCGPGEPATRRLSELHRVVGVDISGGQLRLAKAAAPRAAFARADIAELAVHPASLDAVVSFFALGHLRPESYAPLFSAVGGWLRPGGLLVTNAPLRPDSMVDPDWMGVPMYFGGLGERATRAAVAAAGLVVESSEIVAEDERDGHVAHFLWITATKPG